jgi:hypothetical protein
MKQPEPELLAEVCERSGVARLALFGSTLRGGDTPESDVDLLVEFEDGYRIGYFGLARLEQQLTELFGRQVDLRTPAELSRYFRDEVVSQAVVLFEKG